jgi:lysozyme family protein
MTEFTAEFLKAFNHAMIYEIGAGFNSEDPETVAGLIATSAQRKKVGYVNISADKGGETKYGIAQNSNPETNVHDLNLAGAMDVYYNKYYLKSASDKLSYPLNIIHFDGCVNHGVGRACKFLQTAAGMNLDQIDGQIGPGTLAKINSCDMKELILSLSKIRAKFYNDIVLRTPSQGIFLNGWMRRINEVTEFTVSQL